MAANAEDFVINLVDAVSAPAQAANAAVDALSATITSGTATLASMQARLDQPLKSSSFREVQAQVDAARASLAELDPANALLAASSGDAATAEQALADATAAAGTAATDAAGATADGAEATEGAGEAAGGAALNFRAMAGSTRMLGGEMGGTASKALRLAQMFSKMGPEVAIAVAAFLVFAAVIGVVVGVISKGIEAAGALRDEMLKLQGASKGSASAAKELESAINAVNGTTGLSRDKVVDYATQLEQAGLKGAQLQHALQAMAVAGSAGGDDMAKAFLKSATAAKGTAGAVDALSDKMIGQLGGVASEQALSLSAQFAKLGTDITAIFSGADIEPLLKGIHSILSIFDSTSASGKAMKSVVTDFVNYAIGAFLHAATACVKLYIAVRQNATAWAVLKYAAIGIVGFFGLIVATVALVIAAVVAAAAAIASPFVLLFAVIVAAYNHVGEAWNYIKGLFSGAIAWLSGLSLSSIGSDLINGLVQGLESAGGAVLSAITGIVGGAIDAAKSLLHINSPSKVFHAIGASTGEGMSDGVDASAGDVADSVSDMAGGAVGAARSTKPGAASADGGGKEGHTFVFKDCTFGGETTQAKVEGWMRAVLSASTRDAGAPA